MMFITGLIVGILITAVAAFVVVRFLLRSERRRSAVAERRAVEAEHLAELGTMTGGLAHEIKNPLSTIGLNAELLAEDIADLTLADADDRRRVQSRLVLLQREIERLRGILSDFLEFAGRMHLDPEPHEINELVDELADFFEPQAVQAGVRLRFTPAETPQFALVDSHLFKQALLNLMINATQALESVSSEDGTRDLMLRVEKRSAVASSGGDVRPQVVIHVTDTGPGIPPENLARVFHPYFSTKKSGTGLGLPTTRRIINAHGGTLDVHSEAGRGTDFEIRVPSCEAPERD